jgi:signal peptidase I
MTDRYAAQNERKRFWSGARRPYALAVVAAIIVFILVAPVRVHGDNMSPLLNDGDVVIILKNSYYDAQPPKLGDVLCFKKSFVPESAREQEGKPDASGERTYRFARVAGLPGDTVGERKVGPGEVYVLNDNPDDALDSRDERVDASLDEARGRVVFRIWPIGRFGVVD